MPKKVTKTERKKDRKEQRQTSISFTRYKEKSTSKRKIWTPVGPTAGSIRKNNNANRTLVTSPTKAFDLVTR